MKSAGRSLIKEEINQRIMKRGYTTFLQIHPSRTKSLYLKYLQILRGEL
jgi:hypothetical protein